MSLAVILRNHEDDFICDMAETYGVLEYRALPVRTLVALFSGLRPDSRVMMKAAGRTVSLETEIMAAAVDRLSFLAWAKTKDGQKNRNRPKSLLEHLSGGQRDRESVSFASGADFMAAREKIKGEIKNVS